VGQAGFWQPLHVGVEHHVDRGGKLALFGRGEFAKSVALEL
jgi:hypothetical protein